MNILITGANGQLGNEMRIIAKNSAHTFFFTDISDATEDSKRMLRKLAGDNVCTDTERLDITDLSAVRAMVARNDIQAIVNCAGYTNVDAAEDHLDQAMSLNADAPEYLAVAIKEVNGLLVHISTDYIFGKETYNVPCREDQTGTPTGVYGYTKLCGEQHIRKVGCQTVIIRTAWLYSEFGKNFCKTMLSLTAEKPQLKVVFDQVGTPTYAYDLAHAIMTILNAPLGLLPDTEKIKESSIANSQLSIHNVFNFTNEGVCSWFDFAKMIQEYSGQTACEVEPCHSNEFPSQVVRPSYSVLDKTKFKQTFSVTIPYWTDSLRHCINNLK